MPAPWVVIMISAANNCCRIDAVKASANQLKLKLAQHAAADSNDPRFRSASQQVQSLDGQLKSGDANKAELALSAARSSIERLDYSALIVNAPTAPRFGDIDVRV